MSLAVILTAWRLSTVGFLVLALSSYKKLSGTNSTVYCIYLYLS